MEFTGSQCLSYGCCVPINLYAHPSPNYTASNIGFRCVRDVAPTRLTSDAAEKETPVYPTQISAELLNKYVRQERSKNLQRIRKRARGRCFSDFGIAALAIGVGSYGMTIPKYAIGGFTLAVVGIGFLFSAGVNFWRQWKARSLLNSNKMERLSRRSFNTVGSCQKKVQNDKSVKRDA